MEDLGWLTVTSWRFGEIDKPVGGFGELADLFAGYKAVSGNAVNVDQVQFWQALGTLKWGIICLLQAFTHLSGQRRSVELAAIGTRVSEAEIDLLQIMAPRESLERIELPRNASGCRPTAAELAQAVAEYLNNDAIPALDGRPAFHAKVAANMLGVIERQELLSPAVDAAQTRRLQTLLGQQGSATELNNTLCQHIRDAKLGLDTPALLDHLWSSTSERLAIDQPQYATYQRLITPK